MKGLTHLVATIQTCMRHNFCSYTVMAISINAMTVLVYHLMPSVVKQPLILSRILVIQSSVQDGTGLAVQGDMCHGSTHVQHSTVEGTNIQE